MIERRGNCRTESLLGWSSVCLCVMCEDKRSWYKVECGTKATRRRLEVGRMPRRPDMAARYRERVKDELPFAGR